MLMARPSGDVSVCPNAVCHRLRFLRARVNRGVECVVNACVRGMRQAPNPA